MIEFCPICIKNGYKRRIILNQINLQEAVWLCEYSECPFPFGYQDFTFVSRRVGETWSSDWELGKPSMLKSSESFQISLSELGLDTPPVTPGSGTDTHKDSVFGESSCSGTSLNLSTSNVVQTKANSGLSKNSSSRLRQSYASECGSIDTESTGTRISGEIFASATNKKSNNKDSGSLGNEKIPAKLESSFSLCDDINLEGLTKDLSSQGFIDACNTAEALTESVFNVGTPLKDNFSIHDSTVKCKKWLSDNTKSVIVRDHCYTSPEIQKVTVESGNVLIKEVGSGKSERSRVKNLNSRKQLPKVKSIEKTNVKLAGVINGSNQTSFRKNSHYAQQKIASKNTDDSVIVSENSSESFRVENEILEIDGLLPINVSYEVPNFVEKCITVPWSVTSGEKIEEDNSITNLNQEPVVNNSVASIGLKIGAVDCLESESNRSSFRVENKILEIDGLLPINVSYEIPNFVEECISVPSSVESGEKIKEDNSIIDFSREQPVVNNSVASIGVKISSVDCLESEINQSTISSKTEPQRQSMKKPLKRSIPKLAKYQGFNFGTLKKKSKTKAVYSEENIKFSLPNIPSPDNASCCSDLTWTSETSCATTATGHSKSESVSSSIDRNSTSTSMFIENCIPATSSSESKIMNTLSPEIDRVLEANFNLDQVLDECLMLDDIKDSNQNWEDDWLVSLLN